MAWMITIPASATVAALFYWLISAEFVRLIVALAIIALAGLAVRVWRAARRPEARPTTA